ncbi:MAG: fumarylacetoacetate hydrolase family protein [Candidatus Acidiferrales bacterium]
MPAFCRFEADGALHYGAVHGDEVEALTAAPWAAGEPAGKKFALPQVRLRAPCQPTKIVCVGRNYLEHAAELGNPVPREPLIFLKPPSSIIGPEDPIVYPPLSQRVDFEGELAVVIGRRCHALPVEENPLDFVLGYTCLNDVTARDLQKADGHFTRSKGFDSFCPLGPFVVTDLDPAALSVETYLNGERRQRTPTGEMIFPLDVIIRFIAAVMTLEPGDVISTGTPPGVGALRPGDVVEVVIEGIGRLRNPVVAAEGARSSAERAARR